MTVELVVLPRSGEPADGGEEFTGGTGENYAEALGRFAAAVMRSSGADLLEVRELLVARPLPEHFGQLRNGTRLGPTAAAEVLAGMAGGDGPYCTLMCEGRLWIEAGWDGATHFFLPGEAADALPVFHSPVLTVEGRRVVPEPVGPENPVTAPADDAFWERLRTDAGRDVTLLCERWAHGAHGCTWYRVTPENTAEVAATVRPRSLLTVVTGSELRLDAGLLDEDFAVFRSPLAPGTLEHRSFPGGADSLSELTAEGWRAMSAELPVGARQAVVPDEDGAVRVEWEDFTQR